MIGNPVALLGLLAVLVPVIIHLLGRHRSRVQRFPTLRFITSSRLIPTRRRRLSDIPLLLVRCAIIAAAAIGSSQPYLACFGRAPSSSGPSTINRAIIVDTSLSMRRRFAGGVTALDSARRVAEGMRSAGIASVIEAADLRTAIEGASTWLATRPGTREVVIVSDFQRSAVDSATLASVPATVGIDLVQVAPTGPVLETPRVAARPVLVATPAQRPQVDAAWRAAGLDAPPDPGSPIAIIYMGSDSARRLLERATTPDSMASAALLATLASDPTLREASLATSAIGNATDSVTAINVDGDGKPVIAAGKVDERLALFVFAEPGGLASAALGQALKNHLYPATSSAELDTATLDQATLARWKRDATPSGDGTDTPSDGRWFWLLALALLGLEQWMRTQKRDDGPAAAHPGEAPAEVRAA